MHVFCLYFVLPVFFRLFSPSFLNTYKRIVNEKVQIVNKFRYKIIFHCLRKKKEDLAPLKED